MPDSSTITEELIEEFLEQLPTSKVTTFISDKDIKALLKLLDIKSINYELPYVNTQSKNVFVEFKNNYMKTLSNMLLEWAKTQKTGDSEDV